MLPLSRLAVARKGWYSGVSYASCTPMKCIMCSALWPTIPSILLPYAVAVHLLNRSTSGLTTPHVLLPCPSCYCNRI